MESEKKNFNFVKQNKNMRNETKLNAIDKNVIKKFIIKNLSTIVDSIEEMNQYAQTVEEENGYPDFMDCLIFEDGTVELIGENVDYQPHQLSYIAQIKGENVWNIQPETVEEIMECTYNCIVEKMISKK